MQGFSEEIAPAVSRIAKVVNGSYVVRCLVWMVGELADELQDAAVGVKIEVGQCVVHNLLFCRGVAEGEGFIGVVVQRLVRIRIAAPDV